VRLGDCRRPMKCRSCVVALVILGVSSCSQLLYLSLRSTDNCTFKSQEKRERNQRHCSVLLPGHVGI
jgi:hypothetical protein